MKQAEIARLTQLEDRHWWYAERRFLLNRLIRDIPPDGRALDVGAAGGGNTRVLQQLGWQVLALEYDASAAQVARSRGVPVARADAHNLPLRDGSVRLVTAFDVLEHLQDDRLAVREIRRVLRPGGTAVIAVPADT